MIPMMDLLKPSQNKKSQKTFQLHRFLNTFLQLVDEKKYLFKKRCSWKNCWPFLFCDGFIRKCVFGMVTILAKLLQRHSCIISGLIISLMASQVVIIMTLLKSFAKIVPIPKNFKVFSLHFYLQNVLL